MQHQPARRPQPPWQTAYLPPRTCPARAPGYPTSFSTWTISTVCSAAAESHPPAPPCPRKSSPTPHPASETACPLPATGCRASSSPPSAAPAPHKSTHPATQSPVLLFVGKTTPHKKHAQSEHQCRGWQPRRAKSPIPNLLFSGLDRSFPRYASFACPTPLPQEGLR